jgi:hypothetical protein
MLSHNLLLTGDDAYTISRSLRFRSSASAYLNRTQGTSTNQYIGTWSFWCKRGALGTSQRLFEGYTASSDTGVMEFEFDTNNCFYIGGWATNWRITTQVFRDPSAWYHFVVTVDTTQATANNRIRVYVNGSEITSFSTLNNPGQNSTFGLNNNSAVLQIGRRRNVSNNDSFVDGYLTEINFIDGQALTPSSFGETDAQTGVWKPKKYAGTYGTNGFYLNFSDNSNNTAATIGKDYSGNGNNWTPNNISVTSGSTYDSMTDVPTLTSESAANYATLNPLDAGSQCSVGNGNLGVDWSSTSGHSIRATQGITTGKWYWEVTAGANASIGIIKQSLRIVPSSGSLWVGSDGFGVGGSYAYAPNTGNAVTNSVFTSYGTSLTNGDIVGVAFDADNGKIYFSKNGTWQNSGNPATSTNPAFTGIPSDVWCAAIGYFTSPTSNTNFFNFGQRPFAYTPPTGFVALNTFNLPNSTIVAGNSHMDVLTWTGTSTASGRTFTGLRFQPDFIWSKTRNQAYNHQLYDANRGTGKRLQSNTTDAEATNPASGYISAFNSNGFTTVAGTTDNSWFNETNTTYVSWNWRAGNSTSSNTSGSITSTVSANASAGFSVVTYTGTGSTGTVGHGLGVAPAMIIVKPRGATVTTDAWNVYHASLGNTQFLVLNATDVAVTATNRWNSTSPTSSVFTIGTIPSSNAVGYVAYCWSQIAGYSSFGSYTGNGSTDGPFVFTGFRPRFLLVKPTSITGSWTLVDTARDQFNLSTKGLYSDLSDAEDTSRTTDILSNGFKFRSSANNVSSANYIYAAFAENPFKNSLAR